MNTRLLIMMFGAAAAVWSVRHWRQAVQVGMVLVVLEGAIRKWIFPGSQDLVYFAKDVFFLGAYVGFLQNRWALRLRYPQAPGLYLGIAFSLVIGLGQVFNPRLPNLLVGALGFKAYFLYVPLLFVLPAVFPNDVALARFLKRYVLIAIPVGLLSIAQFFSPPGSILNTYARPTAVATISTFGSSHFVRVTGTFSYITGYTSFLLAITCLILIVLTTNRWRYRGHLVVFAALGLTLLSMLMSGSRGPIFFLAIVFPIYWWLAVVREKQSGQIMARLLLGAVLLGAGLSSAGEQAVTAFSERASAAQDLATRLTTPFLAPVRMASHAGPLGYGIGSTHQAATAVTGGAAPATWLGGVATEAESGRVMLELGPIGFFCVYFVRFAVAFFALRQALRLRTPFHRAIAISALMFVLVQIPGGMIFETTAGVYFWFLAGLVFLAERLDRQVALVQRVPAVFVPATRAPALARTSLPLRGSG